MIIQGNLMASQIEIEMITDFSFKNTNNNTINNSKRRAGMYNFGHQFSF